jgi:hypothetical protein
MVQCDGVTKDMATKTIPQTAIKKLGKEGPG